MDIHDYLGKIIKSRINKTLYISSKELSHRKGKQILHVWPLDRKRGSLAKYIDPNRLSVFFEVVDNTVDTIS